MYKLQSHVQAHVHTYKCQMLHVVVVSCGGLFLFGRGLLVLLHLAPQISFNTSGYECFTIVCHGTSFRFWFEIDLLPYFVAFLLVIG